MEETKKMTKEQYESLKPWEKEIVSAYRNSYLRMTGSDFLKVAEIYKEITGKALSKTQLNCNTCRLNALRKLGEMYVNYNDAPKKKGRPKKLEKNNSTDKNNESVAKNVDKNNE